MHSCEPTETWSAMFRVQVEADGPALVIDNEVMSAGELAADAARALGWLTALGITPQTPIPALLTTTTGAISLTVAGACSEWPIAPLNPRLTVAELCTIIAMLDSPVIVAEQSSLATASVVGAELGRAVAVLGDRPSEPAPLDFDRPGDATAIVLHTSGTTGLPKAVPISQHKLALRAVRQGKVMQLGPGKTYVSFSLYSHIAGVGTLLIALGVGAAAAPVPQFSIQAWRASAAFSPTHAMLVPAMIDRLLAEGALGLPSLEVLLYGSSPILPGTLRRAMESLPGVDLLNMYGQTEGSPLTYLDGADHRRAVAGDVELLLSVGRPVDGVELRIEDATPGGEGQVCARAGHLFKSDADGWLRTGDVGVLDTNGYLRLVGRKGDLIIRGGENVYPREVEDVVAAYPGVREAAVVGVPDDRLGQSIRAYVVPNDVDDPPAVDEMRLFVRTRLAGFKVPAAWVFVDSLPRTSVGKVRIPAEWRIADGGPPAAIVG